MSAAMTANGGGLVAGAMGSGKGSVLWSLRAAVDAAERQILVLAEIEARGLIDAERCFRLTSRGRARLAGLATDGRAER
jgi:Flp pilus assembly CpaF family ATPase